MCNIKYITCFITDSVSASSCGLFDILHSKHKCNRKFNIFNSRLEAHAQEKHITIQKTKTKTEYIANGLKLVKNEQCTLKPMSDSVAKLVYATVYATLVSILRSGLIACML